LRSNFDYFGPQSWPKYAAISSQQKANRLLLRAIMMKYGFVAYEKEWWHFTHQYESYPDKYFDFLVQQPFLFLTQDLVGSSEKTPLSVMVGVLSLKGDFVSSACHILAITFSSGRLSVCIKH